MWLETEELAGKYLEYLWLEAGELAGKYLEYLWLEAGELVLDSLVLDGRLEQENLWIVDETAHLLVCCVLAAHHAVHDPSLLTSFTHNLQHTSII